MKIGVVGIGHFASVVAVCLAAKGHDVRQGDVVPVLVRADQRLPHQEPGYSDLYDAAPKLSLWASGDFRGLDDRDLIWVAYDVPLTAGGAPDPREILERIGRLHAAVPTSIPFLVSCQWPVGTTRKIAGACEGREFVYVMENVRAGKAIADFQACPIPVIGAGQTFAEAAIAGIMAIVGSTTVPMDRVLSWESAEFGKHSLNAFIALQIAFANELARLAPVGVNMVDVTRVLVSDARVSSKAPLLAGAPFGGGSLKRDLLVLGSLKPSAWTPIIAAILPSNE